MTTEALSFKNIESHAQRSFMQYFCGFFLSVICSIVVLQIWDLRSLFIPFNYFGDTIFYAMTIKSVITTGWYLSNPFIGAPGAHFLGDFPTPEGLNYLIIKAIALFTSNWALVLNIFYLLGFPLITLSSLFVLRRFGMRYPFALTASLLFSFLPYRLIKEESHLFLSAYYLIPLAIWLAVQIYQNTFDRKKSYLVAILLGSNGIYHAYFAGFFILLASLIASYTKRQWRPLKYALLLLGIMAISITANIWPTIHNQWKKGVNSEIAKRSPSESEMYGLKIAQLLLPRDDDRVFSKMKEKYNELAISVTENTTASLGLIGSLGFLILLGWIFFKRKASSTMDALAHFNLSALLLATMGGFSSLIAFSFLPGIRAYNRISVFIAFFALAAFFLFLQKRVKTSRATWGWSVFLLGLGLFTQTAPIDAPCVKFAQIPEEYEFDRTFVQQIEQTLPQGSMVFQLPYIYFPEGPRDQINSYAHFKGPLHSKTLKWSFGAMRGRKTDRWQKQASGLPTLEMLTVLVQKGFTGLYVDKFGYPDEGQLIMAQLSQVIKIPPLFDYHGRSFWDLRQFAQELNVSIPSG